MMLIEPGPRWPLMDVSRTRAIEKYWLQQTPPHALMQRAGLACARLALAIAPHARQIWIACGPGNNGGDGLQAAIHLASWGKSVWVTWLGNPEHVPDDTRATWETFVQSGLHTQAEPPATFDLCIDALLGIGAQRPPQGIMADWIRTMNEGRDQGAQILSIDVPSGLVADNGQTHTPHVRATHTLSMLALKTGLFTNQGRDACGNIWLDDLGTSLPGSQPDSSWRACGLPSPTAWLNPLPIRHARPHASHKGSYGEVAIIGGAPGMAGALWLAASGALHHGAGKVFAASLSEDAQGLLQGLPEIMCRKPAELELNARGMAVVCGCGGSTAVEPWLTPVLKHASRLVLDADALNAIAQASTETDWPALLCERRSRGFETVLTPHPLEAARLLNCDTPSIQADRLGAARELAERFQCAVVLKGSGTIIAAFGDVPHINPTGNARLSTGGTGDVLAGMVGAELAAGRNAFEAACRAVYIHGLRAEVLRPSPVGLELSLSAAQVAAG